MYQMGDSDLNSYQIGNRVGDSDPNTAGIRVTVPYLTLIPLELGSLSPI